MSDHLPASVNGLAATDQAYHDEGVPGVDALQIQQRYQQERLKRLRPEATDQFIDTSIEERWRHFQDDLWQDQEAPVKDAREQIKNGRTKVLVLGAGYGGLLFAVRLVEAGIDRDDIRIVDTAAGFGGTWYWNRYPGLMCDIESYTYMPLLEETGYIPKHRYAYGPELREHANRIAEKWELTDKALFQTQAKKIVWDETEKGWQVELVQSKKNHDPQTFNINAQFVVTASGLLVWPQLPRLPGLDEFKGHIFHTARWDYGYTGGSPGNPILSKLQDKNIAIVGTGATAVQCIPQIARWAKHLYVFQRTPSSIEVRDQRETDPAWFKEKVATGKAWQRARVANLHGHMTVSNDRPKENLINDEWTRLPTYAALIGSPGAPFRPEDVPEYLAKLHTVDLARQEKVREKIRREVKDPKVAEALLPWFPSWCKRPCFHDDYLPAFNRDNVTLVDTDGQGVSRLTADSIVFREQSYPVDLIVLSTGFRSPIGTPASRSNLSIVGREGRTLSETWEAEGTRSLHGVLGRGFPNLFFSGPSQGGSSPNQTFTLDCMAQHAAYIIAKATNIAAKPHFAIEPTDAAVEDWANQILKRAAALSGMRGCTPSYFNLEGAMDRSREDPQVQMKAARSAIWGQGVEAFLEELAKWKGEGGLKGLEIRT